MTKDTFCEPFPPWRGWRDTTLTLDDGYRRRAHATLARFFDFLLAAGSVSAVAVTRIHEEIEHSLSDAAQVAAPRHSFMRTTPTPATEAVEEALAVLRIAGR